MLGFWNLALELSFCCFAGFGVHSKMGSLVKGTYPKMTTVQGKEYNSLSNQFQSLKTCHPWWLLEEIGDFGNWNAASFSGDGSGDDQKNLTYCPGILFLELFFFAQTRGLCSYAICRCAHEQYLQLAAVTWKILFRKPSRQLRIGFTLGELLAKWAEKCGEK